MQGLCNGTPLIVEKISPRAGSNSGVSDQNRLRSDCADVRIAVSFS